MLKLAVLALMGAVSAVGVAQAVSTFQVGEEAPQLRAAIAVAPQIAPSQAASISKASDGHYWAEAEVNGERVRFLVDTGASAVALTLADAQRLGIAFEPSDQVVDLAAVGCRQRRESEPVCHDVLGALWSSDHSASSSSSAMRFARLRR